jgi:hypothetical protein
MPRRTILYQCLEHRVYARHRWQHRRCEPSTLRDLCATPDLADLLASTPLRAIEGGQYRYRIETSLPSAPWRLNFYTGLRVYPPQPYPQTRLTGLDD